MHYYLLFIYILLSSFQFCLSQNMEQAFGLRFSSGFRDMAYCRFFVDSTQIIDDGFYPSQIKFVNEKENPLPNWVHLKKDGCFFYWSRTVVLPADARKSVCTVTLNCKSEVDSLRFVVIALGKEDNELHTDSVIIPPTARWTDYSLAFHEKGVRAVQILVRYKGDVDASENRSVYLNQIKVSVGNQELNNLPISSLVQSKDVQLDPKAIIPLSLENDASLLGIQDWKDKKIIALGEEISGIRDLREVQIQLMKYLITSENCKLILLELPEDVCVRWNLYLQGTYPGMSEDQLIEEVKSCLHSPTVFFEFLKWVRQYNAKAAVPVRIIGTNDMNDLAFDGQVSISLEDYLLKLSTTRKDSAYYVHASYRNEFPQIKKYIQRSELSKTLNTQDFQYLLFLMDEQIHAHAMSGKGNKEKESDADKVKRIKRILDIYLSPSEKAVLLAPSERIDKRYPIRDAHYFESDLLGSHLRRQYGKRYHAVSIQIGDRTCVADTVVSDSVSVAYYEKLGIPWFFPVTRRSPFPFSFEWAGMDSGNPYFYYPSGQLLEGVLGMEFGYYNVFRYAHIPSHFDALIFIREAKATRDLETYPQRTPLIRSLVNLSQHHGKLYKVLEYKDREQSWQSGTD